MKKYGSLFSPINIGGIKVKNRIMMSAMDTNYGDKDGCMTEKLQAYLTERARGGTGIITIEASSVSYPEGRIGAYQLCMNKPTQVAKWADAIRSVHSFGSKVLIQLHHGGIQAVPEYSGGVENVCSSDFDFYGVYRGRAMTLDEIEKLKNDFISSAVIARSTGADGVELHAAHMYLLNSFISPYTNKRNDQYGGSIENRGRLLREIVEGVRAACPRPFIISVRLAACDFVEGGQTIEEGAWFAKMCEDAGADLINLSTGFSFRPGDIIDTQFQAEGSRLFMSEAIKKVVSVPVAIVGKLRTAAFCDEAISSGKTDIVVIGRQLICDPAWANKNLFGHEDEVRPCLSCNAACISGYSKSNVQCVLNPYTSHELFNRESFVPAVARPRKITVIGGGIAGMQFAIIAKKRGHDVTIIERSNKLGGQMNLACVPPHKEDVARARDWFISEVGRLGVSVKLGQSMNVEDISRLGSDCYVVATGASQGVPPIKGIENAKGTWEALNGNITPMPGTKILIIGGGSVSCEAAEYLVEKGCNVTVVEILPELMVGYDESHKILITNALNMSGRFTSYCSAQTECIAPGTVQLKANGEEIVLHPDIVLYSTGNVPNGPEIYDKLIDMGIEAYKIGDADAVGDMRTSTRSAYELAYGI